MDASYADHTVQIFTYLLLFMGGLQSGKTAFVKADKEGGCLMFILGQTDQTQMGKVYF